MSSPELETRTRTLTDVLAGRSRTAQKRAGEASTGAHFLRLGGEPLAVGLLALQRARVLFHLAAARRHLLLAFGGRLIQALTECAEPKPRPNQGWEGPAPGLENVRRSTARRGHRLRRPRPQPRRSRSQNP